MKTATGNKTKKKTGKKKGKAAPILRWMVKENGVLFGRAYRSRAEARDSAADHNRVVPEFHHTVARVEIKEVTK